jgi:hypothetical protein
VRVQLAGSLAGIFSQRLVPRISGGLIPAYELLINNSAIANLIREGRTHEITTVIQTSSQEGMIDMDRSLAELVRRGEVTVEHAYERADRSEDLRTLPLMLFKLLLFTRSMQDGHEREGTVEALSMDVAVSTLQRRNLIVSPSSRRRRNRRFDRDLHSSSTSRIRKSSSSRARSRRLFEAQVSALRVFRLSLAPK